MITGFIPRIFSTFTAFSDATVVLCALWGMCIGSWTSGAVQKLLLWDVTVVQVLLAWLYIYLFQGD